jgi:hypothetical protein
VGDNSHVVFGKEKFPGAKGSVRRCAAVMQQLVFLSLKFWDVFAHFMQSQ